ncbi:hypothetical protein [Mammaliicoccus sciuri]|uniref:hypothetical protein n=1 Tax=Mammaliicoccus sciuri TaxID=1296 RepID=UPI001952CB1D|nr:hypothetical protein [Mammaliicoccus sciuri]
MALNKHFNVDTFEFEDRPKPKLWLLKPNGQRIERIAGVSKLQGTFKYTNLNQITFQISPTMFDGVKHEQVKNTVFDKIRNKYIIEFKYNNFRDYFVIDDLKEVSNESENIQVVADSLGTELNSKSMNEIEMLGSTIREMYNKIFENYAPLWSIEHIDSKVEDVKRELTAQQGTVMSTSEQINTLFDTVTIFDNINRKVSVYHKDSVGTNRGLRVRENSYLKSFEDSMVSKDIITRLIPMGSNGLTIHSANPAGSDYIEDFSFFIKPFKRDANRNVIEHSDYMSDELCHALLDYEEFYDTKKEQIDEFTKRYTDILTQHSEEDFKLKSLDGIVERQEDRIELLKPKSEYIELGLKTNDFKITVDKSSYYILMLKNEGSLAHIKFDGKSYQLKSGEWTYIKIDTADFQDATKVDQKLQYKVEMVSSTTRVQAVITRSSLDDYEEEDIKKIEEKYNYLKYKELRDNQKALVASIERRMKQFEDEKADLVASMNPKSFLSDELYKEREQFVYSAIWQEENHTDAKELFDDAEEQLKKKNNVTRTLNVGIVNFVQSLEHKEDWDKLNVGDKIVFSNKFFNKKLKAYITEMQIGFDENSVTLTLSDVFDYKDDMQRVSELLASTSSTSNQVNMHKQQIKESQGKLTKMTELIEGEWDANKQRVLAGNETVDIGSHGVKVVSNENPNEFVIMVGGVIAMTKDGGETFKTGVTPDGVNAEMLIGKMIIGEDLWLENESGTMRFNKDGLHIDASLFHLTTNDGKEDYFDKLKNDLQEEVKQQETRIKESYQRDIQNAIQESVDVENIIDTATGIIQDTFADGIITDVEKKLINDTLSSLEKENSEYIQQIELALNHPYITDEDIVRLEEAYTIYDGMYETLVQSINESISDHLITSDESTKVNEAIVDFRDEVKEILVLVQEILETTRDNQLNHKIEQSLDYTSRLNNDLKDEMSDLNKSFEEAKKTIDDAISDGILDAAETESIKTVLMIMKSEKQDVENRYDQIIKSDKLSSTAKNRIVSSHTAYTNAFNDFSTYVLAMIEDGIANDTERVNYNTKYDKLNELSAKFATDFTYALEVISQGYADSVEGKLTSQIDGMKTEITADLKDVSDNLIEFQDVTFEAFKDGILSDVELSRIKVHQEMLEREYKDVDAGYQSVSTNSYLSSNILTVLSQKRTEFTTAHGNLINLLNNILQVGKITASQKTEVSQGLTTYSTALAEYTKAMQSSLDNISNNMASDIAAERVNSFSGVLDNIQGNINGLQSQVDNAIDTFYYGYVPTLSNYPSQEWTTNAKKDVHIGDFFLNTKTGVAYRFLKEGSTYLWKPIEDQVITDALNSAKTAQDTADGKRRVFVNTPIPPYDIGDMWVQGTSGDIMVCKVARGKNTSYVTTDWGKASKYTDDSKANQVLSDLNTFKTSANQNITNLSNTVNNFQTTVVDAFDDRVIEMAEASSINHSIQLLNNEKARIDRQYTTIIGNADLVGSPKTQLTTAYNAFVTASNSLIQTIQSAIADNKIVPTEKTSVDQKFVEYRTTITNLADKTNAAIDAIIRNVSAGEANKINERFEEWKSSEFLVESDKIAQRVSGSTWSSTYLPQVDDKINGIQVGGRNLLLDSKERAPINGSSNSKRVVYNLEESIVAGETYTLTYDINVTTGNINNKTTLQFTSNTADRMNITMKPSIKNAYTFVATSNSNEISIYFGTGYTNDNLNSNGTIVNAKLEKGNKPTDWSPAPKDFENKIDNIQIGGRNLLLDSRNKFVFKPNNTGLGTAIKNPDNSWTITPDAGKVVSVYNFIQYSNKNDITSKPLVLNNWYTVSFEITTDKETIIEIGINSTGIERPDNKVAKYDYFTIEPNKKTKIYYTFKWIDSNIIFDIPIIIRTNNVDTIVNYDFAKLEEGNVATAWTPAHEDIALEITDVRNALTTFYNTINTTFKDGIISAAEAKSIEKQADLLDNEKSQLTSQYTKVYANTALTGTAKTNLASAKSSYDSKHTSLIGAINSAISDNKITPTEKTAVSTKFTEYRTALEVLTNRLQEANSAIGSKLATDAQNSANSYTNDKIDNIQIGGRNLLTQSTQKYLNEKLSYTSGIVEIDGKRANVFNTSNNIIYLNGSNYTLEEGQTYTFSFYAKATKPIGMTQGVYINSENRNFIKDTIFTTVWTRYSFTFNAIGNNRVGIHMYPLIKNNDETYESFYVTDWQLEKGNKVTDCTPSFEDTQSQIDTTNNRLNSYATTIEANNSFIEQNKNQILSSVSKSEVEATLSKIATYEASYTVTPATQTINLAEYNSVAFSDNYSYEVVAKNNTLSSENVAVATFISKGKGKGFELTEIDNKGSATNHPRFVLNNGKPAITLYGTTTSNQSVSIIYTKYLGSASNIERTNSQIKQLSDEITLEVNKIHEESDMNNMLLNSEFSGTEGWMTVDSPFSIPPRTEMSINTDENLLLHNTRRDTQIIAKTSQYRFLRYVLPKPLTIGQTYTLAFDYKLLNGNNNNQVTILNYVPSGTKSLFNVSSNERNVYTFTATTKSTELLIYAGEMGTDYCKNSDIEVSNATLIEGDKPLKYRKNSSKNVMKMTYNSNISYPSIVTNFMTVGKGQEVSIGEEVTMSTYIYIPSSSKDQLVGDIYFEVAGYENTKQRSNPAIGKRVYFGKENFIYDTWVRYSFTETIPETTTNGKVNYIRALLRFAGVNQSINSNAVFYYGLPQLEKGNTLTKWTPAKLDVLSTEGLATKIALNPESIDIISQNLNINTDVLTIKNTNGNLIMKNDSLTVSNNSNTNEVKINSNGISIKKDGVNKMIDGLDRGTQSVFPYQPRMPSFTNSTNGELRVQHVSDSSNDYVEAGFYTIYWGTYQKGKSEGSLIGSSSDHGRVNRYTFFHEKRYLRIDTTCMTDGVNLIIKIEDPSGSGTEIGRMRMDKTESISSKNTFVDLGTPTFKDRTIEITMGLTGGVEPRNNAKMRIRILKLTDYNE